MSDGLAVVGKRLPRWGAKERATGAARYTVDIDLPGMLVGKVLTSPHAHAKIKKIVKSRAESLPGVAAVITHEDVPNKPYNRSMMEYVMPYPQGELKDVYVLTDKARFVGDPVAAVAAADEATAEKALGMIDVEYEVLPAVFDMTEAVKPGAPAIHDHAENNIAAHIGYPVAWGDTEKGFKEADVVVEATLKTSKQHLSQLEPCACVASFDASGRLTFWSPSQQIFLQRRKLSEIFDIPEGMIKGITPHLGGAFGKYNSFGVEPIAVALAKKTGKPVKVEFTREEDYFGTETREAVVETGKMGLTKDGIITALSQDMKVHSGSYFTHSGSTTVVNISHFLGLYRCPNVSAGADVIYTNIPSSGGCRGYGIPEATFLAEQLIDMAADKLGMDPLELRLKNVKGMQDYSQMGLPMETALQGKCIKIGAEKIGWKDKKAGKRQNGAVKSGVGMAIFFDVSGGQPYENQDRNIEIKMNEDGSANLIIGAADLGTNLLGTCAQIAAELLGLGYEDIHIVNGDTDYCLFDVGQNANCGCYQLGSAVILAATEVRKQILERASKKLETAVDGLDIRDGKVYVKSDPAKEISVRDVNRSAMYNFDGEHQNISAKSSLSPKANPSPSGAVFVDVNVDTETGQVKITKLVFVMDCGKAINPATVEGQLEGAILQGIGYSLVEDYYINPKTGVLESDNFNTYKLPSSLDIPDMEVIVLDEPTPSGPFGAKGVGMCGVHGIAPAIASAIYDAVGVRLQDMPFTPEKLLEALKAR